MAPILLMLAASAGCATSSPSERHLRGQVVAHQHALAARDQRIATLSFHYGLLARDHVALRARLEQAARAQLLVTEKLEELTAINDRIEAKLSAAERQLEPPAEGGAKAPTPSADQLVAEQRVLLRQLRDAHAARDEVMQDLARTVQHLVDTGQLHISQDGGKPSVTVPRSLDVEDPWRYR